MKQYGIITHYNVLNHGAILQLYGLIKVLKGLGVDAKALQFDRNFDFAEKSKYKIGLGSVLLYLKFIRERGIKNFLFLFKKTQLLKADRIKFCLVGGHFMDSADLDGVIIGSDEVFSIQIGVTPVLFGYDLPAKKIFSYGGSFGSTSLEDIHRHHCENIIKEGLNKMVGLGMRDQNSMNIAKQLTNRKPVLTCDPVILYGFKDELSMLSRPIKDPYLLVYAYDMHLNEPEWQESIKTLAKNRCLKVVAPTFFHPWADDCPNVGIMELLGWFKYADCVVTDTFHGCVLSIVNQCEFAVRTNQNGHKLLSLLEEFDLKDRLIDVHGELDSLLSHPIVWEHINLIIEERRRASMMYLRRMIES